MRQKKAILYIRVSTDEQAEKGHSLQHQEERLRNYCLQNGIEVLQLFKEDYSAKTFDRPEWKKVLIYLKSNKEQADLVLFLKWDRFSRNAPEAYNMISVLNKLKAEPQSIEQPLDLSVPENKIMLAIYLATPEVENDRRSLNTIAGTRRALKNGNWTNMAPIGYTNKRDDANKPIIVPSQSAQLVKYAFEIMSTGNYPIDIARKMLNKKGLITSRNNFWWMLRNPIYIGKVIVPAYKDEESMLVDGKHEAIITADLFNTVQDVLLGRKKVNMPSQQNKKEELPLRGFLACKVCGKTLTGSGSKGNGGRYFYYHCTKGCKERFKAEIPNELFYKMLRDVSGNLPLMKTIDAMIKFAHLDENKDQNIEAGKAKKEIEILRTRLINAETLMLDGELTPSDYRNIKGRIEPEVEKLERLQRQLSAKNPEEKEILEFGMYFLRNMAELILAADLDLKHKIIGSMFKEKLIFENNEVRTNISEGALAMIINSSKGFGEKRKAELKKFNSASQPVPGTGTQPPVLILDVSAESL